MIDNGYIKKKINIKEHPVYGKYGLFSTRKWEKFDILGEYFGEFCNYRESEYIVGVNLENYRGLCIDSQNIECPMKYINHYQNIGSPNCKYVSVLIDNKPKIFLVVTKNIDIGEEILADYKFNIN